MKNTFISFRSISLPIKQAVFPKCEEDPENGTTPSALQSKQHLLK